MTVELIEAAAAHPGDLRTCVVFLGGATVGLWFTDPAARGARATYDVDVVAEVTTLGAYARLQEDLRRHGFFEDMQSGITVRYRHRESSLILDVVRLEVRLAGLGSRWLKAAARAAVPRRLRSGLEVRVVPPAWLVVVKLEAFADRVTTSRRSWRGWSGWRQRSRSGTRDGTKPATLVRVARHPCGASMSKR